MPSCAKPARAMARYAARSPRLLLNHHEAGGGESWAATAAARLIAGRGSLDPGTSLGAYRIERFIAAGGMGEVYGAHDSKLGRQVAIKILPDSFTHDPERLARFRREAHVLAALNHPHIGAIYGLEEANGRQFLVLELVDGDTLADRLTRGRLSVDESLAVARQIADALETAHEIGITHRDLKPANIALTADGLVKVLDFGLAKMADGDRYGSARRTINRSATETGLGVILGTAAYMSPEQARGRAADKRSDIWAFGCVLYEMLTGTRAFDPEFAEESRNAGDDVSDTSAAVLRGGPDWNGLPAEVPRYIRILLRQCLERNRTRANCRHSGRALRAGPWRDARKRVWIGGQRHNVALDASAFVERCRGVGYCLAARVGTLGALASASDRGAHAHQRRIGR